MADSKTAAQTAEHAQCSRGKTERIAVRFQISGRVQGVGFRYFALRQARGIGIGGWVKNLPDCRVEAHAEGPEPEIRQFAAALRQGPPLSRVDAVTEHAAPGEGAATFKIRY